MAKKRKVKAARTRRRVQVSKPMWLLRDPAYGNIGVWKNKPRRLENNAPGWFRDYAVALCVTDFLQLTGLKLPVDKPVKFTITLQG